jgi:hypothetical protein
VLKEYSRFIFLDSLPRYIAIHPQGPSSTGSKEKQTVICK